MDPVPTLQEDWLSAERLLVDWRSKAWENQTAHHDAAQYYANLHYWLGIPAAILSTIVGTTVFATLQKPSDTNYLKIIPIVVGGISVLSAIFAGLQTFLRLAERAEQHRAAGAEYSSVRRLLDEIRHLPAASRGPCKDFLDEIRSRLDQLAKNSPNVPNRVWRRASTWAQAHAMEEQHN